MVGEVIEECGGHLRVHCPLVVCLQTTRGAEDCRPFSEGEACRDDDRGPLAELADQMKQKLAAGLGEGEVPPLVL